MVGDGHGEEMLMVFAFQKTGLGSEHMSVKRECLNCEMCAGHSS